MISRHHLGLRVGAFALLALATTACGYALAGRGNTLPPHIRTIGIPQFVNHSTTPDVDRVLTDAVRAEFQGKGKYRIQPEAVGVDAALTVTVTSVVLTPAVLTQTNSQVSRYFIIVTASIEFKDLAENKVIWANPSFQVRDEYEVSSGSQVTDVSALLRSDLNALDRLSKSFSRSVVTSILEAF